ELPCGHDAPGRPAQDGGADRPPRRGSAAELLEQRPESAAPLELDDPRATDVTREAESLVPPPRPRLANQAPPSRTIGGTAQSVSTLLMTVGLPQSPDSTGKGGRVRGIARWPSMDSRSAVSSPRTKPPAPRRSSTSSEKSDPRMRSPRSPHSPACATAIWRRSAESSASPWI